MSTHLRTAVSEAALAALIGSGESVLVSFYNPGDSAVTVYAALDPYGRSVGMQGGSTDTLTIGMVVPRQTGFPPSEIKPGATITFDSNIYDIEDYQCDNGTLDESSSVAFTCRTFGERFTN